MQYFFNADCYNSKLTHNPMKNYYLHNGKEQIGPFSLEELQGKSLTSDTPVWTSDMSDWKKAGDVLSLQHLLNNAPSPFKNSTPPPVVNISTTEKTGFRIGRFLGWTGLIIVVLAGTGFIIYKNQGSSNYGSNSSSLLESIAPREKTPEELRADLAEKEKDNPVEYLAPTVRWRKNLIGETIIEGSIMNNASIAVFKDIVFEVSYLSKTDAVIGTKQFTVYEIAEPGKWASFKFKTYSPSETKNVSVRVVTATPR
jgi:hypothetical protein